MMKKETASENNMSRPHSQKLRPGNSAGAWGNDSCGPASSGPLLSRSWFIDHPNDSLMEGSVAARAAEGTQDSLLPHGLLLAGGNHLRLPVGLVATGELRLLQNQRPLQNHLHRCSRRNHDIIPAREEGVDGSRSRPGKRTVADIFRNISRRGAAEDAGPRPNGRALGNIAYVTPLVPCLLHRAFTVLHLRPVGSRQAIQDARNFDYRSIRENHGGKVQVDLRPPLYPARPHYMVHNPLHINPDRDHNP